MKTVPFYKKDFFANYFTFDDLVSLYFLLGKESLLRYADELGIKRKSLSSDR